VKNLTNIECVAGDVSAVPQDSPLDHPEKVVRIFDTFLRNSFATLTAETDVYVQHALGQDPIPEDHRQSWIKSVSRLSAMLQVRLNAPTIDLDGVPRTDLDQLTKERLRLKKVLGCSTDKTSSQPELQYLIDPDFMLQADLAIALSSVLLAGANTPSATACNTALFYINDALSWIAPTKKDNELDEAQEQRLEQLVSAVTTRIGASCAWTIERKSASAETKSASKEQQ